MYAPKKLALNSIGLIALVFGIVLFLVGFGHDQQYANTLESSQLSVGGAFIVIIVLIQLFTTLGDSDIINQVYEQTMRQ